MNVLAKLMVVFVMFLMAGCHTMPIPLSKSEPGTYNPALSSSLRTQTPQTGTLVVIRDSGGYGSACKEVISVDAQQVGYVHPSQELTVYLKPGQHEVYGEIGIGTICGVSRAASIFTVTSGHTIIMDIHLQQMGGMTITPQNIGNNNTDY